MKEAAAVAGFIALVIVVDMIALGLSIAANIR
jgi:hypothetical protein